MNEQDYKSLLGVYQKKAMDLFTQLVVAESKIQILESQLNISRLWKVSLADESNKSHKSI